MRLGASAKAGEIIVTAVMLYGREAAPLGGRSQAARLRGSDHGSHPRTVGDLSRSASMAEP